ncbi:MAG: UDP-N-acetylglucosamine 1-carboxyvinyltransferase [Actinomycetota bacterium]
MTHSASDAFYRVEGGRRLQGEVVISGAKNSALKLMAASLLARGITTLSNIPRIADVLVMVEVLEYLGARVAFEAGVMRIDTSGEIGSEAPYELVSRLRASVNVLGPLLARQGHARVAMPGGCNIGNRKIDLHELGLALLGASFHFDHGYLEAVAPELVGKRIMLEFPSRGATENLLTAAALARGSTVIDNAAREPDIVDLARFLNRMGAKVAGAGSSTILVEGVEQLSPACYRVPSDPIEAGTFALCVLATRGEAELVGTRPDDMAIFLYKLASTGARWAPSEKGMGVWISSRPNAVDFATLPYPGFPTDLQAPMMAYLAAAEGTSIITENVFESRFLHVSELARMGAEIQVEGHHAVVRGVAGLQGAPVRARDLRGGAALLVAAVSARGTSEIHGIHHIDRGYDDPVGKLRGLGAQAECLSKERASALL